MINEKKYLTSLSSTIPDRFSKPVRCENNPNYKHTKLGWIPEDWEIFLLKNILEEGKLGGNYQNLKFQKGLPLIKMGNIGRGRIQLDKIDKVSENLDYENDHILKKGDLLFNTRNTLDLVGKVAIWRNELPKALYNSNLMRMKFENDKVYSNFYMNYYFNSYHGLRQLRGFAIGTTSVAAIYTRDLLKIKIPLPPLPEQQKIAQILSTWDKAIEKTEQLIQAKTQLKKGMMQKLLTGKKRFKEFDGDDWKEIELKSVALIRMGQSPNSEGYNSIGKGVPLIQGNADIKDRKSAPRIWTKHVTKTCKEGDILITVRAPVGSIAKSAHEACIGRGMASITANETHPDYLYYLLISYEDKWRRLEQGSTFTAINSSDLKNLKLTIPSLKSEQQKIATVLSGFDREIGNFNKILNRLNKQKKGLMQKLLTGEVRVKID